MTPAQLEKRVAYWQKVLNLQHWEVTVELTEYPNGSDEATAAVGRPKSYHHAQMEFKKSYIAEANPDNIDDTIVHEWLHCVLHDLDQAAADGVEFVGQEFKLGWERRYDHELEQMIDHLTRVILQLHNPDNS